jgi:hypothetical protein
VVAVVEKACLGKQSCTFDVGNGAFNVTDPCFDTPKQFAAKITCTTSTTPRKLAPVFAYTVNIPVGSTAHVSLPQFGAKAAVAETAGPVWAGDAHAHAHAHGCSCCLFACPSHLGHFRVDTKICSSLNVCHSVC